jgi:hypothetical protein
MSILNYTTKVTVARTVAEIEARLAKAKAEAILKEYENDGTVSALSFRIRTEYGILTFRLSANIQLVYQVVVRDTWIPAFSANQRTGCPYCLADRQELDLLKQKFQPMLSAPKGSEREAG